MEINLSWDLFVVVFFTIIVAYSYVIGKYQTLKIILSSYMAILAADGVGNLVQRYMIGEDPILNIFVGQNSIKALIFLKIFIFVILTIILATRGKFGIVVSKEKNQFIGFITTVLYGVLSAGLIVSTILVYISGSSLVENNSLFAENPLLPIAQQSEIVGLMIGHYSAWFSLPAIVFIISSIFGDDTESA